MTQRGPLVRGAAEGDLCDPQQQRHTSFYEARGRYTASKRQHRAAALGSLLVRVRTPRARRDVDQGRVLADEGSAGAVSIDVAGGGFPDELAQRIAKAKARTFTNLTMAVSPSVLGRAGASAGSFLAPHELAIRISLSRKKSTAVTAGFHRTALP